jgi:hypothetical protein
VASGVRVGSGGDWGWLGVPVGVCRGLQRSVKVCNAAHMAGGTRVCFFFGTGYRDLCAKVELGDKRFSKLLIAVINCRVTDAGGSFLWASSNLSAVHNPSNCKHGVVIEYTPHGVSTEYPFRDPEMSFSCFLFAVLNCSCMGLGTSLLRSSGECTTFHISIKCYNCVWVDFSPLSATRSGLDC